MIKIVVFSGAGVSAESGISTFRDNGGLWDQYSIYEVATPEAWRADREKVLEFYNMRRMMLKDVKPNPAHTSLAKLQEHFDLTVITQNVDDLHERGGVKNVLHLHGELTKVRSTRYPDLIYDIGYKELKLGDTCERGAQLRPHIVWFGESVPAMEEAVEIAEAADIFLIIGTSLQVYPAAGLVSVVHPESEKYYIDPKAEPVFGVANLSIIKEKAGIAVPALVERLIERYA